MAGRVDQVQHIFFARFRRVIEAHRIGLDGDAALPLEIHRIEDLIDHFAVGDGAAQLDQPVGEGGLAVVDMGDDGEIANMAEIGHLEGLMAGAPRPVKRRARREQAAAGIPKRSCANKKIKRDGRGLPGLLRFPPGI